MPSVVVDAVKMACSGVAHEARGALSRLSGRRQDGRWYRTCSRSVSVRVRDAQLRPNLFNQFYNAYEQMTHATRLLLA